MNTFTKLWAGLLMGTCASGTLAATSGLVSAERFSIAALETSHVAELRLPQPETSTTEEPQKEEAKLQMVANADFVSKLSAGAETFEASGSTSLSLSATREKLAGGEVDVNGLNMVFKNVPQAALTHNTYNGPKLGTLGFAADAGQSLRYDRDTGTVEGKVSGYLDAPYMSELAAPMRDDYDDYVETPRQHATLYVRIQLERALDESADDQPLRQKGEVSMHLDAPADKRLAAMDLQAKFVATPIAIEHLITFYWEAAKRLCVQPVRIGWFGYGGFWPPMLQLFYTGAGLPFGLPGANTEWAKADVVFTVRDWKTVWKSQYVTFDSSEATALKAEVDDADCVEVFFVREFSPASMWGGGATWGLGTANTKIISSDGNAVGGIDLTHLAHEIGHAIGLPHPTGAAGVSTNTLMCPSGWMNDNPKRNSQENKDNIVNPLFTFTLKLKTTGPNCNNSADCGACP